MIERERESYIVLPSLAEDPEVSHHLHTALRLDGAVAPTRTLVHFEVGQGCTLLAGHWTERQNFQVPCTQIKKMEIHLNI